MKIQIQCRVFNTVSKWMRTFFFHLVGHHGIRISATEWFCHMSIYVNMSDPSCCGFWHWFGEHSLNPQIVEGIPRNWRCVLHPFSDGLHGWTSPRSPVPSKSSWYLVQILRSWTPWEIPSVSRISWVPHHWFVSWHWGTGRISEKKTREVLIWPSKSRGANMAICFFFHPFGLQRLRSLKMATVHGPLDARL